MVGIRITLKRKVNAYRERLFGVELTPTAARRVCGNCGTTLYPNGTCPNCDRARK